MCFSASASFTASAVLVTAGIVSLSVGNKRGQWAFAAIPLIFAVQQFIEGFLWLRLSGGDTAESVVPVARAYLVFAQVLWPLWVPLAVLLMEPLLQRRKVLRWTLLFGALSAAYHAWSLFAVSPVAAIDGHHIRYTIVYPWHLEHPMSVLYFIATVAAVFVSSLRRMWLLGMALVLSYLVARISFPGNVISVWCYFAAIISGGIVFLLFQFRATHRAFRAPAPALKGG
jgi:hypothetical protein